MKSLSLGVLAVVSATALIGGGAAGAAPAEKETICHKNGKGRYKAITVSEHAAEKHEAKHGDVAAGSDGECNRTPERYSSPELEFGPNGWAGWSCPAGETAVGGGHTLDDVAFEGLAEGGQSFPHYTFGPDETGYVVQNDNDAGDAGSVFVDCV
jgi:hypothetical protein